MNQEKIKSLHLGEKRAFGKYVLISQGVDLSIRVMPISKKVYDTLKKKYDLPEEG